MLNVGTVLIKDSAGSGKGYQSVAVPERRYTVHCDNQVIEATVQKIVSFSKEFATRREVGAGNIMIITSHAKRNVIVMDERSNVSAGNRALQSNIEHIIVASRVGVRVEAFQIKVKIPDVNMLGICTSGLGRSGNSCCCWCSLLSSLTNELVLHGVSG